MTSALDELYGLGYAHTDAEDAKIEAVTLAQVQAVANKYLKPDALVIAVVKPEAVGAKLKASVANGDPGTKTFAAGLPDSE